MKAGLVTLLLLLMTATGAVARTIQWNSVSGAAGYFLCYGQYSGRYSYCIDVGNVTSYNLTDPSAAYYLVVSAYDSNYIESSYSSEVAVPASVPPQPHPVAKQGGWDFEAGAGTTVADTTGNGHTGTMSAAAWGPGIIGGSSFELTGTEHVEVSNTTGFSTDSCSLTVRINMTETGTNGCAPVSDREACAIYLTGAGLPQFWVTTTGGAQFFAQGTQSVLTGTNKMLTGTYDPAAAAPGVRIYDDTEEVGFFSTTAALAFGALGGTVAFRIGMEGADYPGFDYHCIGRVDQVERYSGQLTQAAINQLFLNEVPLPEISSPNMAWVNASNDALLGSINTPRTHQIGNPLAAQVQVSNNGGAPVTEHFHLAVCSVSNCDAHNDYVQINNTPNALGVAISTSATHNMGDTLAPAAFKAPLAGLTPQNGIYVTDTIDTDDTVTLDTGEVTEIAYGPLTFSTPGAFKFKAVREDGSAFEANAFTPTLTVEAAEAPGVVSISSGVRSTGIER